MASRLAGILVPFAAAGPALAGGDFATWSFDVTTNGEDVFWTSPTALDPAAALYVGEYELTLVQVDVTWLGIPFNDIDVTEQVPPELRMGAAAVPGPAPIVLFDAPVIYPGQPEPTCLAADLLISLDAAGFGQLAATGIVLGECELDLGFGVVTVQLQSVRLAGGITVTSLTCPWDLDGDGAVGIADFLALLAAWGAPATGPPDLDGDGVVGIGDFLALLAAWGACPAPGSA